MSQYFISNLHVKGLWGHRDLKVEFNEDMNIIIGPNASGKTTIINILHHALTVNVVALAQLEFQQIIIRLKSFDDDETAVLRATQDEESMTFEFNDHSIELPNGSVRSTSDLREDAYMGSRMRRRFLSEFSELREIVARTVPAVWLPVSRRLPIADEEEAERRRLHRRPLESVDECLADLLDLLQRYRVSLDSPLAELRKDFQKHALETILYDKQHDRTPDLHSFTLPSEEEKQQLQQAFSDVGFFDSRIKKRIDEHFAAAEDASRKMKDGLASRGIGIDTMFIIPLMNRTKSMVRFAQELETKRTELFASLHSYEAIVNSFLSDKVVDVSDKGALTITPQTQKKRDRLDWRHLSSGEKQIIILLTQALLWEKDPVVYVADEPELSLHVIWQEKLMTSLSRLAGRCQFIVATHSPDIAGGFPSKLIDLGRL